MHARKPRPATQPPLPKSRFDREKVTQMFRDMRIADETGIPVDPGKWSSIRDLLTDEALRTWPDEGETP